jgi:hypothetical protein
MTSRVWGVLVKLVGGLLLFQPLAAAYFLYVSAPLGYSRIVVAIAFIFVALLGAHVGFGLIASRPWARARFAVWAPLHVSCVLGFCWVFSRPLADGAIRAAVVGVLLYGLYYGLREDAEPEGALQAPSVRGEP